MHGIVRQVFAQANIAFNSSPKKSVIKKLKTDILIAIKQTVCDEVITHFQTHLTPFPGIRACCFGIKQQQQQQGLERGTGGIALNDSNLDKMTAEWASIRHSTQNIPLAEETVSPPENTQKGTETSPTSSAVSLPPLTQMRPGVFSSLKNMLFKKNSSNNVLSLDKESSSGIINPGKKKTRNSTHLSNDDDDDIVHFLFFAAGIVGDAESSAASSEISQWLCFDSSARLSSNMSQEVNWEEITSRQPKLVPLPPSSCSVLNAAIQQSMSSRPREHGECGSSRGNSSSKSGRRS
jgi:hypothetical protein